MLRGDFSPHWYDCPPTDERALTRLHAQLEREARPALVGGGDPIDTFDRLTVEAFELAQIGDIAGAQHRLRLRDYPKWEGIDDCRSAYEDHMAEQRAAQQGGSRK